MNTSVEHAVCSTPIPKRWFSNPHRHPSNPLRARYAERNTGIWGRQTGLSDGTKEHVSFEPLSAVAATTAAAIETSRKITPASAADVRASVKVCWSHRRTATRGACICVFRGETKRDCTWLDDSILHNCGDNQRRGGLSWLNTAQASGRCCLAKVAAPVWCTLRGLDALPNYGHAQPPALTPRRLPGVLSFRFWSQRRIMPVEGDRWASDLSPADGFLSGHHYRTWMRLGCNECLLPPDLTQAAFTLSSLVRIRGWAGRLLH